MRANWFRLRSKKLTRTDRAEKRISNAKKVSLYYPLGSSHYNATTTACVGAGDYDHVNITKMFYPNSTETPVITAVAAVAMKKVAHALIGDSAGRITVVVLGDGYRNFKIQYSEPSSNTTSPIVQFAHQAGNVLYRTKDGRFGIVDVAA